MSKKRVFIVGGGMGGYTALFLKFGFELCEEPANAHLVVFTGGEDVSPGLYGDEQHVYTYNNPRRDADEKEVFDLCTKYGIPMVGICRGGQFLNVMSGGRMYQHIERHGGDHEMVDNRTGEHVLVSSTHHQMFMPADNAIIVAVATLKGSREWYDGEVFQRDVSNTDYEVLFYKDTKCLCFQPHPEFVAERYVGMVKYFRNLLAEFFDL